MYSRTSIYPARFCFLCRQRSVGGLDQAHPEGTRLPSRFCTLWANRLVLCKASMQT
ncbi:hypothetical protein M407DRAFT_243309 [Tulasnella calospora MUT 4182]|uniref:Uncharacterized protein n=1 Tax=Tulasnella calospora MUT 4182 TaxID=1051891 RepID=A0A0C3QJY7_9AGAM|nr:hypothetical protein M407DRAFT_243309 [Tulasnella calospora MUT 4182]